MTAASASSTKAAATATAPGGLVWSQLHWPRPLDDARMTAVLRQLAADQRSPRVVLETRATKDGVRYLLGVPTAAQPTVRRLFAGLVPELMFTKPDSERTALSFAGQVKASTRHRALRSEQPVVLVRALLSAAVQVRTGEEVVVQLILGPGRIPLAVPTQSPSSLVRPWWQTAWYGNGRVIDGEKRTALRDKVSDHGFACVLRIGAGAGDRQRGRHLLLGVLAGLRTSEPGGLRFRLTPTSPRRLNGASAPRLFWPLRLNVQELVGITGWPLGDEDLPGQGPLHPKQLPPPPGTTGKERVFAETTAPGEHRLLALSAANALHHTHVLGPTGTGKSTFALNLIVQDIAAGRSVVVVDPQGDLVQHVLGRIPDQRRDDICVLDAADNAPVGLNPLDSRGRRPEVVADGLLAVFKGLYAESWGPRTQDILSASLLTLAQRPDASLVMLPLLFTNTGFRRSMTKGITDPIALGPFWDWYERLSDSERASAIAAPFNKIRQWLLNPQLRAVLGQRAPKFSLRDVFTGKRVLLVSLAEGTIGPEAAALLGATVVAELWQNTLQRTTVDPAKRHPVMVYLDEFASFMHYPTDLATALARSRGMGVSYTLAHQYLTQLKPPVRSALSNTRSRICFQLSDEDAPVIARTTPDLTAEDFTSLPAYHVYASVFANGQVNRYASGRTLPPPPATNDPAQLRALSRERYGRPLDEVEASFAELIARSEPDLGGTGRQARQPRKAAP